MESNNEQEKQTIFKEEDVSIEEETKSSDSSQQTSIGLDQNIAGLVCYLFGFVSGAIIFLIEKENKFVKFHAMQSILIFLTVVILSFVLGFIPIVGWILSLLLAPASFVLWIFMMFKAYQNEYFKLPYIGDMAENIVNK